MASVNAATWIGSISVLLWGTLALLTKLSGGEIPEFQLMAMTFGIAFLLMCGAYALVFHALSEGHVRDFGFGIVGFNANFDLFSYSLLSSFALIHYYYDAFIWKVRKKDVQESL